ncbi:MAG TPA: NAD(P)/FAD-dependent oxidoreductase [Pyrinomonadaceae bacterium]|jgi:phytoene dehydrogenase-like protein|nr:NAD(P)/FAD-dependent oxidoreductase [Pyrinomonadaceae bacterium]
MTYDVTIIGAGHNGLVAACYLAKSGLKTLVLERRELVGGGAVTEELHPGFRCSTLDHAAGPLSSQIIEDLNLARHGLEMITPEARVLALSPDGSHCCIYNNVAPTINEIEKFSANDASSYPEFANSFSRIGRVLAPLLSMTPPSIDQPTPGDLWQLGKVGLAFRGLGKKDEYRLLRWGPMAVADLVSEWFETELLRATVAARGIHGAFAGPWSAGTSLGLLWQAAMDGSAIAPAAYPKGGMGGFTQALTNAAKAAGVEIRTSASVSQISGADGDKPTVVLDGGEEIEARVVVSNADPRTTFLNLVDPIDLEPNFLLKMRNFRAPGVVAKINLALSGLPAFSGVNSSEATSKLSGRIHIGPEIDYLERAFDASKYGEFSPEPYLDINIPSLGDASLAPSGKHVMSVHVQFAPYKLREGDWTTRAEEFANNVFVKLEAYAPGIRDLIVAAKVITPLDLEQEFGLSGGHIHHGEQTLDQFFTFRPLIGWAQYRTPLKRLYLCGAGTHPGGGVTGLPGANAAREIARDFKDRKI